MNPLNLDMPDRTKNRNAYQNELRARQRAGTWNYKEVTSHAPAPRRVLHHVPNPDLDPQVWIERGTRAAHAGEYAEAQACATLALALIEVSR